MQLIEFVATEHVTGEVELDLDHTLDLEETKEMARKEIKAMFPEYDNVEVILVKEI